MKPAAALALVLVGCIGAPPPVPSAVVEVTPDAVRAHDCFRTPITIDGSRSSPHLALVPVPSDPGELELRWSFAGGAIEIVDGTPTSPTLTVLADGERPVHVTLTVVRTADGASATTLHSIAITLPDDPATCHADADCSADERCDADSSACVPDVVCATDADCPRCWSCDVPRATCVARAP